MSVFSVHRFFGYSNYSLFKYSRKQQNGQIRLSGESNSEIARTMILACMTPIRHWMDSATPDPHHGFKLHGINRI